MSQAGSSSGANETKPSSPTSEGIRYYYLRGKEVVLCSQEEWIIKFKYTDRHIAQDWVGETRLSTIFLGIDHSWHNSMPTELFETMIFGGPHNGVQARYSTYEQAEEGHALFLKALQIEFMETQNAPSGD